jgi:hypothetical protein
VIVLALLSVKHSFLLHEREIGLPMMDKIFSAFPASPTSRLSFSPCNILKTLIYQCKHGYWYRTCCDRRRIELAQFDVLTPLLGAGQLE